jgi:hypothetical protein
MSRRQEVSNHAQSFVLAVARLFPRAHLFLLTVSMAVGAVPGASPELDCTQIRHAVNIETFRSAIRTGKKGWSSILRS